MDVQKLVMMGKQIEKNIPDHGEAHVKIAAHLDSFWTPKMRADFWAYYNSNKDEFPGPLGVAIATLHSQAKA